MYLSLSLSYIVFIMLINVKMPTIVCILTFMNRINFVLSWDELEKSFITSTKTADVAMGAYMEINHSYKWLPYIFAPVQRVKIALTKF